MRRSMRHRWPGVIKPGTIFKEMFYLAGLGCPPSWKSPAVLKARN